MRSRRSRIGRILSTWRRRGLSGLSARPRRDAGRSAHERTKRVLQVHVVAPAMIDLILTTLNARYAHAAFGLRYLLANLTPALRDGAEILEFDVSQRSVDVLEAILARSPKIVGVGVYIWNVEPATRLVADLKRVRPDIAIVLGGPEVSYETDQQEIVRYADYVVTGEADLAFSQLCQAILDGERPAGKVIESPLPQFEQKSVGPQLRLQSVAVLDVAGAINVNGARAIE